MSYEPIPVKAPRVAGTPLRMLAGALESGFWGALLAPGLLKQLGLPGFRALRPAQPPTLLPWVSPPAGAGGDDTPAALQALAAAAPPFRSDRPAGVAEYFRAYQKGAAEPEAVARALLAAIRASDEGDPPLRAFAAVNETDVLAQARASGDRWRRGQPLSPLDGVPVAIKDELDLAGYATGGGARVFPTTPAARDAAVAARLRAAGAVLCGKTSMHEVGIGVTGMNPITGFVRNPHNLGHATGGSSAGSAAAVGAGLVPLAIGADGGGSIRIPSALCGAVGIKPTFGRVSDQGALRLCWSVGHVGPIGASARDCALGYLLCAQAPGEGAPMGDRLQDDFERPVLSGLRLGIYRPWFQHAQPQVVRVCVALLAALAKRGARLVDITLPGLEAIRLAQGLTIAAEIAAGLEPVYAAGNGRLLSPETRINVALARRTNSIDYVQAQRVRTQALAAFHKAFEDIDVLVTPTTGMTAPPIRPDALKAGESDLSVLTELMRFVVAANFVGVPAISFPAGFDSAGLPVGLQAMAPWWQERRLLNLAHAAEQDVAWRRPAWFHAAPLA
jgi:Asp-tRNA(Asn)/Glu-tRNA(Gln) amidotransferase A subunit family amidase